MDGLGGRPERAGRLMDARDVRLEPDARRSGSAPARRALAPLGSLSADAVELTAAERDALARLAERLANTYPYGEPSYVGQMLKPPHPIAWAAYATAMLLNPNNHALDGGPATAAMEREAVAAIAGMLGLREPLGHLTSSGTIANLEALWVARELRPGRARSSSARTRTTRTCACAPCSGSPPRPCRRTSTAGSTSTRSRRLRRGGVGTVVATLGTTELGALDPVDAIADLCERHGARLHVDAAYGGFYALLADGGEPGVEAAPFAALERADSIVVDPHKHGLQPYGCGCVLFADPAVGRLYAHDSPYTYFTSKDLHLGEISLECSRAGAAAAALWTTLEALPLTRAGLGAQLAGARAAALALVARARRARSRSSSTPELDIVCPFPRTAVAASAISARASAHSTRSRRPAGTWRSCASTPPGCAAVTRGSRPTPTT